MKVDAPLQNREWRFLATGLAYMALAIGMYLYAAERGWENSAILPIWIFIAYSVQWKLEMKIARLQKQVDALKSEIEDGGRHGED